MPFLASALALRSLALPWLSLVLAVPAPLGLAIDSPWWENYDRKDQFRCDQQQVLVLERNDSQASILMGGQRTTLFRDRLVENGLRYRGEGSMVRLQGDELQLELTQPMPTLIHCQRTENV